MTFRAGESGNWRGRPKGAVNRRSKAYLEEAERRGVAPLQVLIEVMEHFKGRAKKAKSAEKRDAYMIEVRDAARIAAPYVHPKLRQVEVSGTLESHEELTDEELARQIGQLMTTLGIPVPPAFQVDADAVAVTPDRRRIGQCRGPE